MKKNSLFVLSALIIIIIPSFLIIPSLFAQVVEQKKELVIIRVTEVIPGIGGRCQSLIHITEDDGTYRIVELENVKKYLSDNSSNQRLIHMQIKMYLDKGYKIVSHNKGVAEGAVQFEDYILLR